MKLKYIIIYTLALIVLAFFSFESEASTKNFKCGAYALVIDNIGDSQPLIASIIPEAGVWIEVPSDEPNPATVLFYNIKDSRFAALFINHEDKLVLQIFRDGDFLKANYPVLSTSCTEKK